MSEKDVVENVDSPGEISIPIADNSTPGIASFDSKDFTVDPNGKVSSIVERGIPQYLGKITGTGTGTTDLNWKVDMNTVKQNKPIKLGEYIMLIAHFNQFVPGDIFRITSVQIEGSKYTVKTNNVRVLSLASIVGPQGEQGNEGKQGVPYLAYTNSIESTTDPVPSTLMYLDDGHFNRTPIATSDTYRDVVTVDWYNKTTHRAFMVTGLIQGKNNATNQWVADITAATDITGAVGPQGKEGAGIADIVDIDYPHGEFTSVQYDTTDGIKMQGIAEYLRDDGETYQILTDIDVPIVAGAGISIDKKATEEKVEIKIDTAITDELNKKVNTSENFVKAFTIPNGASSGTLTTDVKEKLCNPDGHNYYVYDDTSQMILKYSFNADDEIIQYKAVYLLNDKAYDITMQILLSNGSWRRSQTVLDSSGAEIVAGKGIVIDSVNGKEQVKVDIADAASDTSKTGIVIPFVQNATTKSIRIGGDGALSSEYAIGIGYDSYGPEDAVAIGHSAHAGYNSICIGNSTNTKPPTGSSSDLGRIAIGDTLNNIIPGCILLGVNSDTLQDEDRFVLADGTSRTKHNYFKITKDSSNVYHMLLNGTEVPTTASGGEAVTPSTATSTATSGTFTSAEWAKLQANDNNYILFNNEIYRLADKAHSGTTGIWSYTHTGWDGTAIMDKSINVTVSTGAWTLVIGSASAGGKLYLHSLLFKPDSSTVFNYYLAFYSTFYTNITYDNVDTYSSRIPFSILYHVDNSGYFLFDGIIYNIQQGPPPKNLALAYPGISNIILEFISDSVVEV